MGWLPDPAEPAMWFDLATLTLLDVVPSIDNPGFIAALCDRSPWSERKGARQRGPGVATDRSGRSDRR
jgi:predicted tellurium resistance membrane protein TerC